MTPLGYFDLEESLSLPRSHALHQHALPPRAMARPDDDVTHRHTQLLTEKSTQGFIGRAIDRWRGNTNLQCVAMEAGVSQARRIGLDVDGEQCAFPHCPVWESREG